MTPKDRVMRGAAYAEALEELFKQHPIPGNPDRPWKAEGIEKTEQYRWEALEQARNGQLETPPLFHNWHTHRDMASRCKVPEAMIVTLHTLIYG